MVEGQVGTVGITGQEAQGIPAAAAVSSRDRHQARRAEARSICRQHFAARDLPMRFVDVDFDLGGRTARIFYSSESRIDHRGLFRDLCRDLRMRVTMCRLGPRDLAKRTGTCGPCGRALCCKSFLADFPPVAVKMVKEQQFPLTPDRSAGMCRRLKCCLTFERANGVLTRGECGGCCLPPISAGDALGEHGSPGV